MTPAATPTLVLLPGMDGTGELFTPFVAALGSAVRVQVVRYPTGPALGYEALTALARQTLPSEGPFVILGESFSGPIAITLAAARPPGLVGLVLCCTFVRTPRPALAALRWLVDLVPVRRLPVAGLGPLLLGRHATAPLRAALASTVAQVSVGAFRARAQAALSVDVAARFSAVQVPTLYLQATRDRVVPSRALQIVLRARPATEVVPIEAPHALLQATPDRAAAVVRTFLRRLQDSRQDPDGRHR